MYDFAARRLTVCKRLCVSAPFHLLRSHSMEFIASQFQFLQELIVTHQDFQNLEDQDFFMDSRLHILYKSLLRCGVNVVARADGYCEKYLYIATSSGVSLLTKALPSPFYWSSDCYVYITQSPGLDVSLPLMVEMVLSQVFKPNPITKRVTDSRCHVATNHVKISSDMEMKRLKQALMGGVTSFNIWRDGDEELSEEEVAPINMTELRNVTDMTDISV